MKQLKSTHRRVHQSLLAGALSLGLLLSASPFAGLKVRALEPAASREPSKFSQFEKQLKALAALEPDLVLADSLATSQSRYPVYISLQDAPTRSGLTPPQTVSIRNEASLKARTDWATAYQKEFLQKIKPLLKAGLGNRKLESIQLVDNALSLELSGEEIKALSTLPEIKALTPDLPLLPRPTLASETVQSKRRKRSLEADAYDPEKLKGQGRVIAIIDSGFSVDHPDMRISDPEQVKYTEKKIQEKISTHQLKGQYVNIKFPYAYNFADGNQDVEEPGKSHGTHVAGIAAGSGNQQGEHKGQAPEAQVLALRVFGKGQKGTSPKIYNKALDEAVLLQADSINLSLGSAYANLAGLEKLTRDALSRANDMGATVAISAGNSGFANHESSDPTAHNPYIGTVGSPAIAPEALAVASLESLTQYVTVMKTDDEVMYPYVAGTVVPLDAVYGKPLEVEPIGLANLEVDPELANKKLNGKIALIERGTNTFVDKVNTAQKLGASVAIIYNHETGTEEFVGMVLDDTTLPALSMRREDALQFIEALKVNPHKTLTLFKDQEAIPSKEAGKLSTFSSWGPTPEFDLKPEITALGGNVYAAQPGGTYGNMSGTSMASPQIAGLIALLHQRYQTDPSIQLPEAGLKRAQLTKNLLMSTAVPHTFEADAYSSPRRQGAGVANREALLTSHAYLTATAAEGKTPEAKISLGSLKQEVRFEFTIHNFSKEKTLTFKPEWTLQTDALQAERPAYIDPFRAQKIGEKHTLEAVTVAPGESKTVQIQTDFSDAVEGLLKQFENGFYVEGFVRLISQTKGQPDLSLPFVGLRGPTLADGTIGETADLPVLEKPIYTFKDLNDPNGLKPRFYSLRDVPGAPSAPFTALISESQGEMKVAGETTPEQPEKPQEESAQDKPKEPLPRTFSEDEIFLSPNDDGHFDTLQFQGVFLAPFYEAFVRVRNDLGETVYESKPEGTLQKPGQMNWYERGNEQSLNHLFHSLRSWSWDGTLKNGMSAKEGAYTFEFSAKGLSPKAHPQVTALSFTLDATSPKVKSLQKTEDQKITATFEDALAGLKHYSLTQRGQEKPLQEGELSGRSFDWQFTCPEGVDPLDLTLTVVDRAGNKIRSNLGVLLLGNQTGRLKVNFVEAKTQKPMTLSEEAYHIQVVDPQTGREFEDLDHLPLGTYQVTVTSHQLKYQFPQPTQTVTFTSEQKQQTLQFEIEEQAVHPIQLVLEVSPANAASKLSSDLIFTVRNEKGQTATLKFDNLFGILFFLNGELTPGEWTLEVSKAPEGFWLSPESKKITVDESGKQNPDKVILNYGKALAIEPMTQVEDGGTLDPQTIRYRAYNGSAHFTDLSQLTEGPYLVYPDPETVPEDYYVEPDSQLVKLVGENAKPVFKFHPISEKTQGEIEVETVMTNPEEPTLAITYQAERLSGQKTTQLKPIPFGSWYVLPKIYDPRYTVGEKQWTQKTTLSPEQPKQKLRFEWTRLSAIDAKGSLLLVRTFESEETEKAFEATKTPFKLHFKNLDTGAEFDQEPADTFLADQYQEVPFGYYEITPVLPEGFTATPSRQFVVVKEAKKSTRLANLTIYRGETPEKTETGFVDSKTGVAVSVPGYLSLPEETYLMVDPMPEQEAEVNGAIQHTYTYEIQLMKGQEPIEFPLGFEATVSLPLGKLDPQTVEVFHQPETGEAITLPHEIKGDQVVFKVTHFSLYGLRGTEKKPSPASGSGSGETTPPVIGSGGSSYFDNLIEAGCKDCDFESPVLQRHQPADASATQTPQKQQPAAPRGPQIPATGEQATAGAPEALMALALAAFLLLGWCKVHANRQNARR